MDTRNQLDDWQPCPTGELSRMTARLDALQSGARFRQLFGTGLLSMFLCAAGVVVLGGYVLYSEPAKGGGISCQECQAHADEFYNYWVGKKDSTMDPAKARQVKKHLKKCDRCRSKFNKAHPDKAGEPLATCEPCLHHCNCEQKLSGDAPPAEF